MAQSDRVTEGLLTGDPRPRPALRVTLATAGPEGRKTPRTPGPEGSGATGAVTRGGGGGLRADGGIAPSRAFEPRSGNPRGQGEFARTFIRYGQGVRRATDALGVGLGGGGPWPDGPVKVSPPGAVTVNRGCVANPGSERWRWGEPAKESPPHPLSGPVTRRPGRSRRF